MVRRIGPDFQYQASFKNDRGSKDSFEQTKTLPEPKLSSGWVGAAPGEGDPPPSKFRVEVVGG